MEVRNLTNNPTDYIDAYCDAVVGHTNWAFPDYTRLYDDPEVHSVIIIYNNPEEEE